MSFAKFRRLTLPIALCAVCFVLYGFIAPMPLPSTEATSSISARDLKRHLSFLASTELGGRYTISPSNLVAARYLASELEYYGLRPAASGSYFQKVPLVFSHADGLASSLVIKRNGAASAFRLVSDFLEPDPIDTKFGGQLVFAGYGISSPEKSYDDYANLDAGGKTVIIVRGHPASLKAVRIEDSEMDLQAARAHGAVGAIIIDPSEFSDVLVDTQEKPNDEPSLPPKRRAEDFPEILAGPHLVAALAEILNQPVSYLHPAGKALRPQLLDATVQVSLKVTTKPAPPAQNVVGILDGTDPTLKDEYVVLSAHYDHLMTRNGQIYRGADDDGSGVVSVLEIAQALAKERPKRSVLVIFHTGEELGLFGSEYNTDYSPVVPLSKLVCDLNIDMVGRSRPPGDTDPQDANLTDKNSIYIIGADKLSSELNEISQQTDADTEHFRFDYTYNDEANPERFYYRSDHYNYAKHGIPIIFYFTGVHRDYHQPTDTVDKIDFDKMERIDRMIFATAWRIANLDHRLVVDRKG
ncbi:MAG TPA: M28 family peptidase [Blastocatellia bacterium]